MKNSKIFFKFVKSFIIVKTFLYNLLDNFEPNEDIMSSDGRINAVNTKIEDSLDLQTFLQNLIANMISMKVQIWWQRFNATNSDKKYNLELEKERKIKFQPTLLDLACWNAYLADIENLWKMIEIKAIAFLKFQNTIFDFKNLASVLAAVTIQHKTEKRWIEHLALQKLFITFWKFQNSLRVIQHQKI